MKIAIVGSGSVGGTLGTRWAQAGHEVIFSSRHPESDEMKQLVAKAGITSCSGSPAEAVAVAEVVLVATPWPATRSAVEGLNLAGKVVIDATNPLLPNLSGIEVGTTSSGGELMAEWAPGAKVVKAFNTIGFNIMADPKFGGSSAVLLYCGDDAEAKKTVHDLAALLGFDPVDAGPLKQSRVLEPAALLWISLAYAQKLGRDFAFTLVKR